MVKWQLATSDFWMQNRFWQKNISPDLWRLQSQRMESNLAQADQPPPVDPIGEHPGCPWRKARVLEHPGIPGSLVVPGWATFQGGIQTTDPRPEAGLCGRFGKVPAAVSGATKPGCHAQNQTLLWRTGNIRFVLWSIGSIGLEVWIY